MTTALDIIKGALRRIGSYQSGEQIAPEDAEDCLQSLNDLLDSFSTQKQQVLGVQEFILEWVAGQNIYQIGNPTCQDLGEPPFTGTVTGSSATITGVTSIPADLKVGATLTDLGEVIPPGTTCVAFDAGAQTVTMSQEATDSYAGLDQITYTVPGDFAIPRPLRLTSGYTRINSLDFTLEVMETEAQYNAILYKAQPGPWPTVAWYNPGPAYGTLRVYQTPGNNGELHLFADSILANLTLDQTVILPQGYNRHLKWALAEELWPEYHGTKACPQDLRKQAQDARNAIKALNGRPPEVARYDPILVRGNRPDGGWIFHGGYR